ncbi:MAG: 3'-5' exonuclease, partial [Verrucomicrobiota bacterium]|nr:3'-5' exonuclease [Verrucomicrobiota bacterium]
ARPAATFEDWLRFFQEAHGVWLRGSAAQALRHVMRSAGMRARLVRLENGERRLTNVLQLADLVHQASAEKRLGMGGTLGWLAAQIESATREESEAHELRLESDADAARIMTIFKSKGLQFPVVFAPTLWRRQPAVRSTSLLAYHERNATDLSCLWDQPFALALDLRNDAAARARAEREKLEEDVRLFYVGATRAIHRTCVIALAMQSETTALSGVLGASEVEARLHAKLPGATDLPVQVDRRDLDGPRRVTVYRGSDLGAALPAGKQAARAALATRAERENRNPFVNKGYGHTSFSALTSAAHTGVAGADDRHDFDAGDVHPPESAAAVRRDLHAGRHGLPADEQGADAGIFAFPAGTNTGECWHSIFEELDFKADDAQIRAIVRRQLERYRLLRARAPVAEAARQDAVVRMVRRVLDMDLAAGPGANVRLNTVSMRNRLSELNFSFPLKDESRTTAAIWDILRARRGGDPARQAFLERPTEWNRAIPRGFMTGFMDLVFRSGGRYYIVDWKSNNLGGATASFTRERIATEMGAHRYFLQYLIYTVALDQYLRGFPRLGYDYESGFGGVFYMFLRGYENQDTRGVFFDRPDKALVRELAGCLGMGE